MNNDLLVKVIILIGLITFNIFTYYFGYEMIKYDGEYGMGGLCISIGIISSGVILLLAQV